MAFLRHNWLVILFLAAIIVSFAVTVSDSRSRDDKTRATLVEGCTRTSGRTALDAAYKYRTAEARRSTGDEDIARDYDAFAQGQLDLIPAPKGFEGNKALADVEPVYDKAGKLVKYKVSPAARELHVAGCERIYKP